MAAQTGFLRYDSQAASCLACAVSGCGRGASVTCPPEAEDGRVPIGELDVAGLSWTSWGMIQKVRRADQAHSGTTDATRTERGFHAAGNGETAGQRPFRWVAMGAL